MARGYRGYNGYTRYRGYRGYNRYRNNDNGGCAFVIFWGLFLFICFINSYWKEILIVILISFLVFLLLNHGNSIIKFLKQLYRNQNINRLKKHCLLYLKIIELNEKYYFEDLEPLYFSHYVGQKYHLKECNIDDYLLLSIDRNYFMLRDYKKNYDLLSKRYSMYLREYKELDKYINMEEAFQIKMKYSKYLKYQNIIYDEFMIKKKYEFKVVVYVNYRSPKGNVQKRIYKCYDTRDFPEMISKYFELKKNKRIYEINSRIERAKMSSSLRYEVLKRDQYRCCICGSTAKDGVKLEVDHIIPVSKGGRTVMDNLQVLCERCNRGKSNKM